MFFTAYEKDLIDNFTMKNETKIDDLSQFMDDPAFNFLKSENNLKTIHDSLFFLSANKFRPYEVIRLTKFLTPEFDMNDFLNNIIGQISPPYFTFIDFHFLALGKSNNSGDMTIQTMEKKSFKLQKASKASAINNNIKIFSSSDFDQLVTEFKDKDTSDLLNDTFVHHCELFEFQDSGLVPYQLLSMVVHIQKFKANFF
jgi:hypothetical protein